MSQDQSWRKIDKKNSSKLTFLRIKGLGTFLCIVKGIPSGRLSISGKTFPLFGLFFPPLNVFFRSLLNSLSSLVGHKSMSGTPKLHGDDGIESSLRSLWTSLNKSIGLTSRLFALPVDFRDFLELRFITIPLTLLHADLLFLHFSDGECCTLDPYVISPSREWLRRSSSWNDGALMKLFDLAAKKGEKFSL